MPFIPHTDDDIKQMLAEIGVTSIEQLFDEIPASLKISSLPDISEGMSEMEMARLMQERAKKDEAGLCFIGAGAYEHYIPAAVWDIVGRGEFYSPYAPYQAEASQGTLQLLYEYQSMMVKLTGLDVSNASLYDGASALAQAVLMAVRCHTKSKTKRILIPKTVHPVYRQTVKSIVQQQNIQVEELPYSLENGRLQLETLSSWQNQDITALIIPQPNFFGTLEEVDQLTDWAHQQGALVIAVTNPVAMAMLKEPGSWGQPGADIVCGEAQPLGIPLASGGPYLGFICCKQEFVRQMPGKIIGRTVDIEGKEAFALTLQAREQHIRRSKATSNLCTAQVLLAIAATIHMSLLGPKGLRQVAANCHQNATKLQAKLLKIKGVNQVFHNVFFHEFVLRFEQPVQEILTALAEAGIQGGYSLTQDYPELGECLLICATETKSEKDLQTYYDALAAILNRQNQNVTVGIDA